MVLAWAVFLFFVFVYAKNSVDLKEAREAAREEAIKFEERIKDYTPTQKIKICSLVNRIAPTSNPALKNEYEKVAFRLLVEDCYQILEEEIVPSEDKEDLDAIRREFDC